MERPTTIRACERGHRCPDSLPCQRQRATCPKCDLIELVALAYGDCQTPPRGARLLTFRTEMISEAALLSQVVGQVPGYNAWRSHTVLTELRPIFPKLMGVEFGREASPVLYAFVPYWRHQAVVSGWSEFLGSPVSRAGCRNSRTAVLWTSPTWCGARDSTPASPGSSFRYSARKSRITVVG
ncbi:MAG: hypothetical protein ACRDJ4_12620 [Actinomycetota bacterium]